MTNIAALFEQSVASHQSGDLTSAATGYAKVLTQQPDHADAWHYAGILAYQNGRPSNAVEQIQRAIDLNPTNPEYFSNLASILNGVGQFEAAAHAAHRATEIDAGFHPAHYHKGKALANCNRFQDAVAAFEMAIECGGNEAAISVELASILKIQGHMPEAIEQLQSAIQKDPSHAQAYIELSTLVSSNQFQFTTAMVADMLAMVNDPASQSGDGQARLQHALAIHFNATKNVDRAFQHYQSANRTMESLNRRSKRTQFNADDHRSFTQDLIDYFDEQTVEQLQSHGHQSGMPVFVIGMPRSGTTLIHQLLSNHSSVAGMGELTTVDELFHEHLLSNAETKIDDRWPALSPDVIAHCSDHYLRQLSDRLSESQMEQPQRTIDKMPGNYNYAGFVKTLFSNAKFIHCFRDPRDVCLSCFQTLFGDAHLQAATSTLDHVADLFLSYRKITNHWQTIFGPDIYSLDYRNIVENPDHEIRAILKFLDLPFEEQCCTIGETNSPVIRTASVAQARKPIYQSSLARWKRYQSHLSPLIDRLQHEIEAYENGASR